jgi:hypothetical protein
VSWLNEVDIDPDTLYLASTPILEISVVAEPRARYSVKRKARSHDKRDTRSAIKRRGKLVKKK